MAVFALPGLGRLLVTRFLNGHYGGSGLCAYFALIIVLINLFVDLVHLYLDRQSGLRNDIWNIHILMAGIFGMYRYGEFCGTI